MTSHTVSQYQHVLRSASRVPGPPRERAMSSLPCHSSLQAPAISRTVIDRRMERRRSPKPPLLDGSCFDPSPLQLPFLPPSPRSSCALHAHSSNLSRILLFASSRQRQQQRPSIRGRLAWSELLRPRRHSRLLPSPPSLPRAFSCRSASTTWRPHHPLPLNPPPSRKARPGTSRTSSPPRRGGRNSRARRRQQPRSFRDGVASTRTIMCVLSPCSSWYSGAGPGGGVATGRSHPAGSKRSRGLAHPAHKSRGGGSLGCPLSGSRPAR